MLTKGDKVMLTEDGKIYIGTIVGAEYHVKYCDEEKNCSYIVTRTIDELKDPKR